ncbi:MAG: PPC domain-containing protein [Candidatus Bathyarchaeia archaeon]
MTFQSKNKMFSWFNSSGKILIGTLVTVAAIFCVTLLLLNSTPPPAQTFYEPEFAPGGGPNHQVIAEQSPANCPEERTPLAGTNPVPEGVIPGVEELKEQIENGTYIPPTSGVEIILDPATSYDPKDPNAPSAPTQEQNFPGISWTGWIPPDPEMAVGPDHIIVVVNSSWAIYTKDGTQLYQTTFSSWFGLVSPSGSPFDPWVFYDDHADRWVFLTVARNVSTQDADYLISVSQTSNPMGSWWVYKLDATLNGGTPTTNWADYPKIGYDSSYAVYITGNMFSFAGSFQYSKIRVIRKSELYSGSAVSWHDYWGMQNEDASLAFTIQPCDTLSSETYEYLVNTDHWSSGDGVTVWRITKAWPPTLTRVGTVNVGSYTIPPDAEQMGSGTRIDTIDCRLFNAVCRNSYVYTTYPAAYDWGSGVRSIVRYLKINPATATTVWNEGFGATNSYYYMPAISCDANNNMYLVFSRSGPTEYASIRYTGRLSTDGTIQSTAELAPGLGTYVRTDGSGRNRWGDYGGIGIDHASPQTAWIYHEYATASNTWATQIGRVTFASFYALSNDSPVTFSAIPKPFTFQLLSFDWAGVAINPSTDHDIRIDDNSTFTSPYASSIYSGTVRDFVVSNGHSWGDATHYAQTYSGSPSPYTIEAEWDIYDLVANTPINDVMSTGEVMEMYEMYLTTGTSISLTVDVTSGSGDLDVFVFRGDRSSGSRSNADWSAQNTVPGGDEVISFTPPVTGFYAIAVINENGASANYTISYTTCTLPAPPANPSPADGATGVSTSTILDWSDSVGATSYDVYLGTAPSPPYVGNVGISMYNPGTLNCNTHYYWKVVAKNSCGTNPGPIWDFYTVNCSPWSMLTPDNPDDIDAGNIDANVKDELIGDFGGLGLGLWAYYNYTSWSTLTGADAYAIANGDIDNDGISEAVASFPSGIWTFDDTYGWNMISAQIAENLACGDLDNNGQDEIIADFGSNGLQSFDNNTSWRTLTPDNAIDIATGDKNNDGMDEVCVSFGALGLWSYANATGWMFMTGDYCSVVVCGDLDNNGQDDVVGAFPGIGLFSYFNNSGWMFMTNDVPTSMAIGDVKNDLKEELVGGFPLYGMWVYEYGTGWAFLTGDTPENIACGDFDNDGKAEICGDFGWLGVWVYR